MAFKQYTKCIDAARFNPNRVPVILGYGIVAGSTALGMVALSGRWDCWPLVPLIAGYATVVGYCENWLYARLVCLGGDRDCIGMIVSISPPSTDLIFSSGEDIFDFDWDTDHSINLLLQNTEPGTLQPPEATTPPFADDVAPFGFLIKHQDVIEAIGLETKGAKAKDKITGVESAILHAEFEGAGNYILMKGAEAALGLAIAALFACIALPFPVGLILGLLSLLALILGGLIGNYDVGSPSDTNTGELHDTGHAEGADIVYVQGTWVFDPLHQGYNEIHPIKVCTIIGKWDGDWETPPDIILRARRSFDVARDPETIVNQSLPEHQWLVHPDLDGCTRDIIL